MKIKVSKINTQSDSLIKEKSRKEKRHKQKSRAHIFSFALLTSIKINGSTKKIGGQKIRKRDKS